MAPSNADISRDRVFVLGHRGMLGHVVAAYLHAQGCEVITHEARYGGTPQEPLLEAVRESGCAWIINALGAIPQKGVDVETLFRANTHFPLHLLQCLHPGQRLIHASTDCVFSGARGRYHTQDLKDAANDYGLSKALGEAVALDPRVTCLRVSIVGPEGLASKGTNTGGGLLGWFLKQQGPVQGYTNHFWNGITTLEWAKAAMEMMRGTLGPLSSGVVQLGVAEHLSKHDLLRMFAEVWEHPIEIQPFAAPEPVDRTLVPQVVRPPLREQLRELREWMQQANRESFVQEKQS
ncbi:sugar nucleotide-binding protein [Roseimicrobium sp. ORNL1]|uniref:sugar nucleotide-binding protein n=1 Tax=Roseimicrobium sp. ORNL1 TaxID=2711231 RepID=UPI0013E146D9|nr:sugar nucleotide-binding protein [Roseimicrobium sp. ORNL1]QIF02114.1 sugar nucleotide-binding protein [Roseimicrobium sp. ORNL1]